MTQSLADVTSWEDLHAEYADADRKCLAHLVTIEALREIRREKS